MKWMENITGLQHIGIPTNHIEKTVEFYKKIGFSVALDTKNKDSRVVFLKLGDLVVETYQEPAAAMRDGAINHMALNVKDIDQAYQYVKGLGVQVLEEVTFLPFWEKGVKFFIIQGPNMERIEFAQYL